MQPRRPDPKEADGAKQTNSRDNHLPILALISATALAGCRGDAVRAQPDIVETTPHSLSAAGAEASPERMAQAAREFLDALSPQQRTDAEFPFDADSERTRWSNLPASMVERAGLGKHYEEHHQRR